MPKKGRRKPPWIRLSNVTGLNPTSSDIGATESLEPLPEELRELSKDDDCSSHDHMTTALEDAPSPIAEAAASDFTKNDMVADLATTIDDSEAVVDFPPLSGFHQSPPLSISVYCPPKDSQMKPDLGTATLFPEDEAHDSCPIGSPSLAPTSLTRIPSQQVVHPNLRDKDKSKSQWSHLFADNRKPLDDFMLKKVDIKPMDGCLDFSDPSMATEFLFEPPFCMIGYFYGIFPGVADLRRLYDSWFPATSEIQKSTHEHHEHHGSNAALTSCSTHDTNTADPPCPGIQEPHESIAAPHISTTHDDPEAAHQLHIQQAPLCINSPADSEGFKQ
ncbi:hypothetical protein Dimus_033381, partial [Dionaea muscipula]